MKRLPLLYVLTALMILLLPGNSFAQGAAPPPWYPPDPSFLKDVEHKTVIVDGNSQRSLEGKEEGSVTGRIVAQDSDYNPNQSQGVSGALIKIYNGDSCRTCISASDGYFTMNGLRPGESPIVVSASGFRQATGKVHVGENASKNVLVSLHPLGYRQRYGYINVYAYGREDYEGKWIGVRSIRVHEIGNYHSRWNNNWSGLYKVSYQSLYCRNAEIGGYYRIEVTWSDGSSQTSDMRLGQKYRDVSIYR